MFKIHLGCPEPTTAYLRTLACTYKRSGLQYGQLGRHAPVQEPHAPVQEPRAPVQELKIVYLWSKITILDREKYSNGVSNVLNPSQSITGH